MCLTQIMFPVRICMVISDLLRRQTEIYGARSKGSVYGTIRQPFTIVYHYGRSYNVAVLAVQHANIMCILAIVETNLSSEQLNRAIYLTN
jgi:hypothetical protein